ncbi:outer membrane lipoprotein-sorting protein [uncultured Sphaerochaeta sp.]|uniref:outer membrane lipoprotein-sorting protein n=1 Tax=uncultured Sphaerochaeta sp. TaxID=886478 RepID=UPI002A0A1EDE|nr:outer membrane lipoprotein-sorting protein [uncultured Sphaerochaeta sp.]
MNSTRRYLIILFVCTFVTITGLSAATLTEGQSMLKTLDDQSNLKEKDFSALMTMISEDPDTGVEKTKVLQFRSDNDDKFLLLIQEPAVKKGQGYLLVDDNLWFYDPESRKFSHTSMKDQFNQSDANNSDFNSSSLSENYKVASIEEGKLGNYSVYILDIEALNNEVTYPKQKLWVTASNTLLLKSEDYSASGRLMRTSYYPSYTKSEGNFIPTKMIFVDELIPGKKTTINIGEISFKDIPDTVFTKSYVERVNN